MAHRSLARRVTYDVTRLLARLAAVACYQIRCEGRRFLPRQGPALVCSNHQSFLDPILVGLACDRRLNYLARASLFHVPALGGWIQWYGAIPIERDGFGLTGMRETLRRLRQDQLVLVFPEGTRTHDGQIAPLMPGIAALARRSQVPLVPVAIDGAYQAWPRDRRLPGLGRIWIQFGPVISREDVLALTDAQLLDCLRERLQRCHQQAQRGRRG